LYRNFHSTVRERQPIFRLLALASLVAMGCGGEQANRPRDGGAGGARGGAGGGADDGGGAGRGGSAGSVGGIATGSAGDGSGGTTGAAGGGGTGGTSGTSGSSGSSGSSGTTGGVGGTGGARGGAGGTGGAGGRGGTGGAGGRPTGSGDNGTTCTDGGQCKSSWCVDGVCCINACTGTCMRCTAPSGNCQPIPDLTDPENECAPDDPSTCGNTGDCNGAGACRKFGNTTVCDTTPSCDNTTGSIVTKKVCDGLGRPNSCVANSSQSCNGFACVMGSTAACGTSCSDDSGCAKNAFCGAATCVGTPNIAGNGDLEYGSSFFWSAVNGTSSVGVTMTGPHDGMYAVSDTARTALYLGPGYALPTGQGIYNISVWARHTDPNWPTLTGVLQVRVICKDTNTIWYPFVVQAQTLMPGTWALMSGTIDTRQGVGADCAPVNGGLVRSAVLYLNQSQLETCTGPTGGGPVCPDLYMDDLVVNTTDGHNLIGNPNFEAGAPDGWGVSSGMASQAVVTTFAHSGTGTHSLRQYNRQLPVTGPKWLLPSGYGRYNVSLWVMQNGLAAHDLTPMATYTCQGGTAQSIPAGMTMMGVAPGVWTQLTGTVTVPPPNAPAGCKLTNAAIYVMQEGSTCGAGAGQVECPDLYIDDASITMPASTP
jgi:hypothetical protein